MRRVLPDKRGVAGFGPAATSPAPWGARLKPNDSKSGADTPIHQTAWDGRGKHPGALSPVLLVEAGVEAALAARKADDRVDIRLSAQGGGTIARERVLTDNLADDVGAVQAGETTTLTGVNVRSKQAEILRRGSRLCEAEGHGNGGGCPGPRGWRGWTAKSARPQ